MTYQGIERRQDDRRHDDHDLLLEVHTMLVGFKENYDAHVESDDRHFSRLYNATSNLKWYIAIGIGILATLKFILK